MDFLNIEPLVTTLLAALLLGEPITFIVILGGAIIIIGIYLVNRSPRVTTKNGVIVTEQV